MQKLLFLWSAKLWTCGKMQKREENFHTTSTQPEASSEIEPVTPTTIVQDIGMQTDATSTTELQNIQEEYEKAISLLNLGDMVEEKLDSLEAFAKSVESDDSEDSGVDEYIHVVSQQHN